MPGDTGPVFVTHGVAPEERVAVKRFRSLAHGDEARREWRALELLARHAPGLAARPVSAELDAEPPVVVMSRLPGEPLGTGPVTDVQLDAVAAGLPGRAGLAGLAGQRAGATAGHPAPGSPSGTATSPTTCGTGSGCA